MTILGIMISVGAFFFAGILRTVGEELQILQMLTSNWVFQMLKSNPALSELDFRKFWSQKWHLRRLDFSSSTYQTGNSTKIPNTCNSYKKFLQTYRPLAFGPTLHKWLVRIKFTAYNLRGKNLSRWLTTITKIGS